MNEQVLAMPSSVRTARTVMCVQIALSLLLVAIMALAVVQTGAPQAITTLALSALIVAAVGFVVVKMRTRQPWVKWAGIASQAVLLVGYLPGLVTSFSLAGLAGVVLAGTAIASLLSASSSAWFSSGRGRAS